MAWYSLRFNFTGNTQFYIKYFYLLLFTVTQKAEHKAQSRAQPLLFRSTMSFGCLYVIYQFTLTIPFLGVLSKGKARRPETNYFILKVSCLSSIWYIDFYA